MKIYLIAFLLIISVPFIISCGSDNDPKMDDITVGYWGDPNKPEAFLKFDHQGNFIIYWFRHDLYNIMVDEFTYTIDGNLLSLIYAPEYIDQFSFEISGNTMTWISLTSSTSSPFYRFSDEEYNQIVVDFETEKEDFFGQFIGTWTVVDSENDTNDVKYYLELGAVWDVTREDVANVRTAAGIVSIIINGNKVEEHPWRALNNSATDEFYFISGFTHIRFKVEYDNNSLTLTSMNASGFVERSFVILEK